MHTVKADRQRKHAQLEVIYLTEGWGAARLVEERIHHTASQQPEEDRQREEQGLHPR